MCQIQVTYSRSHRVSVALITKDHSRKSRQDLIYSTELLSFELHADEEK